MLPPPNRRVKRAIHFQLQAGVHGDSCHVGDSAGSFSLSLCRYLTDIHCSEDESHIFYNLQKKKNLLGPVRVSSVPLEDRFCSLDREQAHV